MKTERDEDVALLQATFLEINWFKQSGTESKIRSITTNMDLDF